MYPPDGLKPAVPDAVQIVVEVGVGAAVGGDELKLQTSLVVYWLYTRLERLFLIN